MNCGVSIKKKTPDPVSPGPRVLLIGLNSLTIRCLLTDFYPFTTAILFCQDFLNRFCNSDSAEGWKGGKRERGKEGKRAAGAIGGGFWESVLKRKKKAMIWAGYFSESRK